MHKLFPIPLEGQGTSEVESLPSYLLRSAYDHGVTVGVLLQVILELLPTTHETRRTLKGKSNIEYLARTNRYSDLIRKGISDLTGQNLNCEPLDYIRRHINNISKEIGGIRWCPECLSEMKSAGSPLYIKQIWHIKVITHCHLHRTPLVSNCEHCGKKQLSNNIEKPLGYCLDCGKPLFVRRVPLKPSDMQSSWQNNASDIVAMFENTADLFRINVNPNSDRPYTGRNYKPSNKHAAFSSLKDGRLQDFLEEYCRRWEFGPSLINLRRLVYRMNLSIFELLGSDENPVQLPLIFDEGDDLPKELQGNKKIIRNHVDEYLKLLEILKSEEKPPSLKLLARLADLSVGYLEYRFPSIVRQVVNDNKKYIEDQSNTKKRLAEANAVKFFTDEKYSSFNKSRKEAYRVLREETNLPKWVLKNAIQKAYMALYM